MSKFKVGDRVRHLVDKKDIPGTVIGFHENFKDWYYVKWDREPDPVGTPYEARVLVRVHSHDPRPMTCPECGSAMRLTATRVYRDDRQSPRPKSLEADTVRERGYVCVGSGRCHTAPTTFIHTDIIEPKRAANDEGGY